MQTGTATSEVTPHPVSIRMWVIDIILMLMLLRDFLLRPLRYCRYLEVDRYEALFVSHLQVQEVGGCCDSGDY